MEGVALGRLPPEVGGSDREGREVVVAAVVHPPRRPLLISPFLSFFFFILVNG